MYAAAGVAGAASDHHGMLPLALCCAGYAKVSDNGCCVARSTLLATPYSKQRKVR